MKAAMVLAASLVAAGAHAHLFPGERSVVVQAEERGVAILISYRPASTTPLRPAPTRGVLRARLAARALAVLDPRLDGAKLEHAGLEAKLVEDGGRPRVVLLLTARVPDGAHTFTLDVGADAEPTATRWLDRSAGRVVEHGPRPAGVPFQDRGRLVLTWR